MRCPYFIAAGGWLACCVNDNIINIYDSLILICNNNKNILDHL